MRSYIGKLRNGLTVGAEVYGAVCDVAGRDRRSDPDGQIVAVHEGDVVVVEALGSSQSELGQRGRGNALDPMSIHTKDCNLQTYGPGA
jgi:hypothetical protein